MISVNERNRLWTPEHQAQSDRAEALIDQAIRESEDDTVQVDISSATTSKRVVDHLCAIYRDGGWLVTVIDANGHPVLKLQVKGAPRSGPGAG